MMLRFHVKERDTPLPYTYVKGLGNVLEAPAVHGPSPQDQLMLARSSAERKARTSVSGPRNIPGGHHPNPDIHSNSRNISAAVDPAAVVDHGGTISTSLSWRKPVSTAPNGSGMNGSTVNNNGHLGSAISGTERLYNGAEGTVSGGTSEGAFVQPMTPNSGSNTGAVVVTAEAAPSAFVLRSAGHVEGELANGGPWHEAGAGSRSRLVLPSIESSLEGRGGAMRAVSEGVRGRDESFSFPEMALVQEHWQACLGGGVTVLVLVLHFCSRFS